MSQGKNTPFGLKLVAINLAAGGSAGLSQRTEQTFWGEEGWVRYRVWFVGRVRYEDDKFCDTVGIGNGGRT